MARDDITPQRSVPGPGQRHCPCCKGWRVRAPGHPCHHCRETGVTNTKQTRREKLARSRVLPKP